MIGLSIVPPPRLDPHKNRDTLLVSGVLEESDLADDDDNEIRTKDLPRLRSRNALVHLQLNMY